MNGMISWSNTTDGTLTRQVKAGMSFGKLDIVVNWL